MTDYLEENRKRVRVGVLLKKKNIVPNEQY